jgi:RpiB/LacA/LacB family sugar-phosphate isomerase
VIRRLGAHSGKRILFGYDRYLVPDLAAYRETLEAFGEVVECIDDPLHYLTSAERLCVELGANPPGEVAGILVCGTGIGMSIAANKFRGVYAARCITVDDAQLARTINNANVLCLASNEGFAKNHAIIRAFMQTAYAGRKLDELSYISEIETTATSDSPEARAMGSVRRTA